MKALGVTNVLHKDIQNIQTLFLKNENGREMYSLLNYLENLNYVVRVQVGFQHDIKGFFFIHESAIKETRRWPEALTIDATYKTNAHRMSLVNIVGTSNVSSTRSGNNRLQTFAVAAAFINSETEDAYTWILKELRDAIWPAEEKFRLPSVIVTDNERALRNAIDTVFPECQHLLCTWHLWNNLFKRLSPGSIDSTEFNYRRNQVEVEFKKIVNSYDRRTYEDAVKSFEKIVCTPTYFEDNGAKAMEYLRDV